MAGLSGCDFALDVSFSIASRVRSPAPRDSGVVFCCISQDMGEGDVPSMLRNIMGPEHGLWLLLRTLRPLGWLLFAGGAPSFGRSAQARREEEAQWDS